MNERFKWDYPSEGLRYPRTLDQAFGPGTSRLIEERQDPMPQADRIVVWASVVSGMVVLFLILAGVI